MIKYSQTVTRIGTGLAAIAALATWLWPAEPAEFLEDPFAIFAFATALAFWIAAEIKFSEEVLLRKSSPNDIRLARILLQYHAEQFRVILKDHDFHSSIEPRYVSEVSFFLRECAVRHLGFQNDRLLLPFQRFSANLARFSNALALYTVPYQFPIGYMTSVRAPHEIDDYKVSERHRREIDELNDLGSSAWDALDKLISSVKKEVPEVLDEPLNVEWLAPSHYDEITK